MQTNKLSLFILLIFFHSIILAQNVTLSPPPQIFISAYAIEDYSNHPTASDLGWSIGHKNKFVNKMTDAISSKYPSIPVVVKYDRENSTATTSNFLKDNTNNTEFVLFVGHGNQQYLSFYNSSLFLNKGIKKFGGNTYWVIFDACLVLNVNKASHLSEEVTETSLDSNRLANIYALFDGVHSIMGNYALGYQGSIKKHWYSSARWRTEDIYYYFATNFIKEGETIWDAYSDAVKKVYKNFHNNAALGYSTNLPGFEPAMWYFYGTYPSGKVLDMSQEKFALTYNAPVKLNSSNFKTKKLMLKRLKIGSPKYD